MMFRTGLYHATIAFDFDTEYIEDFKSDKILVNRKTNAPIHYPDPDT